MTDISANIYTSLIGSRRIFINSAQTFYAKKIKQHATDICRHKITQSYINSAINSYKNGYIYIIGDEIIGFVIWKLITLNPQLELSPNPIPTKHLFIQLICAQPTDTTLGYTMLYDVEQYCYQHNIPCMELHTNDIKLEEYYKTYGFYTTQKFPFIMMWKPVLELLTLNPRRKTRKNSKTNISPHNRRVIEFLRDNGRNLEIGLNYTL
jgi:hypothetical protein